MSQNKPTKTITKSDLRVIVENTINRMLQTLLKEDAINFTDPRRIKNATNMAENQIYLMFKDGKWKLPKVVVNKWMNDSRTWTKYGGAEQVMKAWENIYTEGYIKETQSLFLWAEPKPKKVVRPKLLPKTPAIGDRIGDPGFGKNSAGGI